MTRTRREFSPEFRREPVAPANRKLLIDVRRLHAEHHDRYGSPRMHAALRAEGRAASRGRLKHSVGSQRATTAAPSTSPASHTSPQP